MQSNPAIDKINAGVLSSEFLHHGSGNFFCFNSFLQNFQSQHTPSSIRAFIDDLDSPLENKKHKVKNEFSTNSQFIFSCKISLDTQQNNGSCSKQCMCLHIEAFVIHQSWRTQNRNQKSKKKKKLYHLSC